MKQWVREPHRQAALGGACKSTEQPARDVLDGSAGPAYNRHS